MRTLPKFRKLWRRLLPVFLFFLTLAGCSIFTSRPSNQPFPIVSSLPPPQLPDWIEEINPTGEAKPLSQIRVIFKDPLIPLESLDSPQQQSLLNNFEITPALPGKFRFLTPRMVGFQADQALPLATRIQVTLKQGLTDLNNHRLEQDLAWTFNTEGIKLSNLPGTEENPGSAENPIGLNPTLTFNSNTELSLDSLQKQLQLISSKTNQPVPLKIELDESEETALYTASEPQFDPSVQLWKYNVTPTQPLEKATQYNLQIQPGLQAAKGNLGSQTVISTSIQTYEPLTFENLTFYGQTGEGGTYGRFVNGSPQLQFNNGIIAESALENITLNPPPKEYPRLIQAYDNHNIITLNPWALEPQTNYTLTLGEKLKDQFDQTLGKPVTVQFKTGDIAADLWVPTGLNIFPANQDLELNISTVNLPEGQYQATYQIVQPTNLVYTDTAYPRPEGKNLLPSQGTWKSFSVENPKNQPQETKINLPEKLRGKTGMLAYGVKAQTTSYQKEGKKQWNEPEFFGLVQLTNLGVFAQWFPESGMVRVHHLDQGSPAANVAVEIYQSKLDAKSFPKPEPCAIGTTNQEGILLLSPQQLQQCMGGDRFNQAPELLVIAKQGKDWAFTRTLSYSGEYGYGISANWNENKPLSRGVVFSDRQLYQPGEKVALTGAAYYLDQGQLKQDKNVSYTVNLTDPKGQKQELGNFSTNEFGTFSLEFNLEKTQPLGTYSILAKSETGAEITGEFRVAEFKPPNFKVDLTLNQNIGFKGDTITANTESQYLFGAPVVEGQAKYYVTRTATEFTPKGWEQYSFGPQWFWPEEKPTVPTDVLQTNQVLNGEGKGNQTLKIAQDLPYPMKYRVDVEVIDVSNLAVANSQELIALPMDRLIGLKSKFVADAGKAFPVEFIVTDSQGNAVKDAEVKIELQKMNYSQVTRVVEGGKTNKNQIEYQTVDRKELRSEKSAKTVSLTAKEAGSYRIRASFKATSNPATVTDLQIWVTGDSPVSWGGRYDDRLEIKLDKDTYKPGEIATALIQSPYPEAELYFAVVRDKPLYQKTLKIQGGAPEIQFKVTPEMLPNAAVEAVLVRQGQPLSQVEPGSVENLAKIGFSPFKINLEEKYLQVQLTPTQATLEPGSQQTLQLQLKDAKNKPLRGQFTVMVVNDAILQLNGYRPPNLVETVYAEQSISTRFSDNRPNVILQNMASPIAKGWGYGGGFSAGTANPQMRKDFQPLAYYKGSVITDNLGKATVSFKLPDDLTTWRVMAVATDGNLRFGSGESTFITTKSLISNPILPQFARPGDRILSGISVTNQTGEKGTLQITGNLNQGLVFSAGNSEQQTLETKAESGTQAYRFPILVERVGTTPVKFTTTLNGKTDAFEVPLDIKPIDVTEQVVETGTTTKPVNIPLDVNEKVVPNVGGLNITLASTLMPQLEGATQFVFDQTEWPFLEPAASQLFVAANLQILGKTYGQTFAGLNLNQKANQALEKIAKLQQEDGGLSAYPEQQVSDPFVSAYAAEALSQAQKAGFSVNPNLINALKGFLNEVVTNPGKYEFCGDAICKNRLRLNGMLALSALGETRKDFVSDIYGLWDEFDLVSQIKLARYLSQFPEWKDEFNTLFNAVQKTVYQTGRTATVNFPQGYDWLSSPTLAQAQALRLFVTQKTQPEITAKLVQSLLNLQRKGTWGSVYENAEALTALVAYPQTESTPPNFAVNVDLSGQKLGQPQFKGYQNSTWNRSVPMTELPKGNQTLKLQPTNNGKLHYWVSYAYRLEGNQPGRLNGLRVVRTLQPVGEKPLETIGLNAPEKPIKVAPGQVFDIGLEIITDHPVDQVMITDPIPAGFEAIDSRFKTSNPALKQQETSWKIDYQTIYRDRITAYSDRLEPGVYQLHYLVRSVTPGEFLWPGAEAHLQYAPEEFGRTASSIVLITNP